MFHLHIFFGIPQIHIYSNFGLGRKYVYPDSQYGVLHPIHVHWEGAYNNN